MSRMIVRGIQHVDFKTDDGNTVRGNKLHCSFADKDIIGERVQAFFIRDGDGIQLPKDLKPGDPVNIHFDYKTRIESISPATLKM